MNQEELLKTVEESGECEFQHARSSNIPVGIFLSEMDAKQYDCPPDHKWQLNADNFMPRKGLGEGAYRATAPTREALVEVVRKYILPLYEAAMANLAGILAGTNDSLYYWDAPDVPEESKGSS